MSSHRVTAALASAALFVLSFTPVASAAPFPTLREQMLESKAIPGSALAKLIRDNQDMSLLRPEEAKDQLLIPAWLRVLWRKSHPEGVYDANDPTGGYPLVLREVHEWMMSHQDLKPGPGHEPASAEEAEELEGKLASSSLEQRISGLQTAPRSESDIRINPWDPTKIISASNNISGSGVQGQYWSTDGGTTWNQTTLSLQPGDAFHSDPTVDWTSDGTAWSTTIGIDSGGSILHMRAYKSTDNGATWTFDNTFSGAQTNTDKQLMWVDHSNTSPFKDNIYAIWHNGTPAFMNRRTGPAGSWQTPIQVSGAESTGTAIGSDVKTNAFGDVFGFWPTTTNRKIFVVKSTNGGVSYGTPVQIGTTFDSFDIGVPSFNSRRALVYIMGGAYRTALKDMVYATWVDLSGETGCTAAANEPGSNAASTCKTRVWFSRSTDGGATWSPAVMLNNQPSLNDQYNQGFAVDEATGALSVVYYDTVADASRKKSDLWYQSSFNDGVTWSAPFKVTTGQTDETTGGQDGGNQYGDYNALSGVGGVFFPSWTDRRGGAREEIWTARIADAACTPPGAPVIGTATATAPNTIQVTWSNGAPASNDFNVYRATGTCAANGGFSPLQNGVAASPYDDLSPSGGSTYAYRVTGRDATGNCESSPSACVQATATGACTLTPTFGGLGSATNQATASCATTLAWTAATANCGGPITYTVYRSTSPGFTPSGGNQIATGVSGTGYSDTAAALTNGVAYYYIVRATDASNGLSESNSVIKSTTPTGPIAPGSITETFEAGGGFDNSGWTHTPLSGVTDWALSTAQSQTPTHSWFSADQPSISERVLVSPSFVPSASSTLSFWHTFAFESATSCFDAGVLDISTNDGATWVPMPIANFTAGVYNGVVSSSFSNPLGGRNAWCSGTIGAMTQVTVNLASFNGSGSTKVRWHEGDDTSANATGWFVDSVTIANVGIASSCTSGGPSADLSITKTDGVTTVTPGGSATYTIVASNSGPAAATGAAVADTFPASLTCSWSCVGAGGGTCTASGSGNINDLVNLPNGGSVTYTASCTVSASATGTIVNTATVAAPAGTTDPVLANDSATDSDTVDGAGFYAVAPCRVLDTRDPNGPYGGPILGASQTRGFLFAGRCGIPADATAVSANLAVVSPGLGGYLNAYAANTSAPTTSILNFNVGTTRANNAIIQLGLSSGVDLKIFNGSAAGVQVIVDVNGYFK